MATHFECDINGGNLTTMDSIEEYHAMMSYVHEDLTCTTFYVSCVHNEAVTWWVEGFRDMGVWWHVETNSEGHYTMYGPLDNSGNIIKKEGQS